MIILPIVVIFVVIVLTILSITLRSKKSPRQDDRKNSLKEAKRRLTFHPKDPQAFLSLADLYFEEREFRKAMRTYQVLFNLGSLNSARDEAGARLRYGLAALHSESWPEAYRGLMEAKSGNPDNFELICGLGKIEFKQKNYEKSLAHYTRALKLKSNHAEALKNSGQSLFHLKRYTEAADFLERAISLHPDDKESLFILGKCRYEEMQVESAQKIFRNLQDDPVWGPAASLHSGIISAKNKEWEKAAEIYEAGLKHESTNPDLRLELKYQLAEVYSQSQRLDRALAILNKIHKTAPDYKDVEHRLKRFRELNSNKNLQAYLFAPLNDFINLCRRLVQIILPGAVIKTNGILTQNAEYVDILTEYGAQEKKHVLFRFLRGSGQVGELFIRDLFALLSEHNIDKGFCITAGAYTDQSAHFIENGTIVLIDKASLLKHLKLIDAEVSNVKEGSV